MSTLLDWLSNLPQHVLALDPVWLYVVCGALVFAEDAIFVGFALPGETAAVLAGVATAIGQADLAVAIVVVVGAAIVGDTVGYEIGKHVFGPRVLETRLLAKHRDRLEGANEFLRKRGGGAVFLGRFTAFLRAMMPALAGSARMPYRRFVTWNALGGVIWGTSFVLLGHLAGASYAKIQAQAGRDVAIGLAAIVVLLLVYWRVRRHRRQD